MENVAEVDINAVQELLIQLVGSGGWWVMLIPIAVFAAKTITPWTPTKVDDKVMNVVFKVLNVVALNFGKDKNADAA